ncbi:MAG TPA: TIGR02147 family protein [Bdellovibrio sp.]|nr:TIGR02147 family protein [Bdellovibrio sp.]
MNRPEIFRYFDYRLFLKDYFTHLSAKDKKYSMRWIAQRAGLKSPQLLTMILKGERKLSVENAQLLSLGLNLSEKEEEYLLVLLELESAQYKEKQLEILDRIRYQFQNGLFKDLTDNGFEYIRQWFYPAIREMCAIKDLQITPNLLAHSLNISLDEASESLQLLVQWGFLKLEGNKYLRSEPSIKASDYISPLVMAQYHLQMLERAFQAAQLKRDLRHFDSLTIALPSRDMEKIREKIRQFVREIDMMGESASKRDDVFQLNIQFFSVTGGRLQGAKS